MSAQRRPFTRRRKSCPFSGANAPKIDYKDVRLPQKKALRATKDNIAYFESQRKVLEAQNLERRSEAEAAGGKMKDLKVTLVRQASEALQLYGSVTSRDIAEAAGAAGVKIERGQVELDKAIKALGAHKIRVVLHP